MQNEWWRKVFVVLSLTVACVAVARGPAAAQAVVTPATAVSQVQTKNGRLEGVVNPATGVRAFKGVPFAAPPVGDLRWKPPQPVRPIGRACARPTTSDPAHAAAALRRHGLPLQRHERGLPVPERLDARRSRAKAQAAGAGVFLRRRLRRRATARNRATTARAWPEKASWPSPSTTASASSASSPTRN